MRGSLLSLLFFSGLLAHPGVGLAQPTVTLNVDDALAAEANQDPAGFTVTRTDDGGLASPLNVVVQRSGNATINADYQTTNLNGYSGDTYYVVIPANQTSISVSLKPLRDNLIEGDESIGFTLAAPIFGGHDYTIGEPSSAQITLLDFVDAMFADGFED